MPRISWSPYHHIVTSSDGGMGRLEGGSFMLGSGYHIFSIFGSVFVLSLIVLSRLVHDSLLCLFHCAFFVSVPFN